MCLGPPSLKNYIHTYLFACSCITSAENTQAKTFNICRLTLCYSVSVAALKRLFEFSFYSVKPRGRTRTRMCVCVCLRKFLLIYRLTHIHFPSSASFLLLKTTYALRPPVLWELILKSLLIT